MQRHPAVAYLLLVRPTNQLFSVSCRIDQTGEAVSFVNDPSTVRTAGEHFGVITLGQESDCPLGHVFFIFKINFRSQVMLERVDVTFSFLFRNLPPATADRATVFSRRCSRRYPVKTTPSTSGWPTLAAHEVSLPPGGGAQPFSFSYGPISRRVILIWQSSPHYPLGFLEY